MKPTINNIHFVRAAIAKAPTAEEIKIAVEKANQKYSTVKGRCKEIQIYTR